MDWFFRYRNTYKAITLSSENTVSIPIIFHSSKLIIRILCSIEQPYKGKLIQRSFIDGFGYVVFDDFTLRNEYHLIRLDNEYMYKIDFSPSGKIGDFELSIWSELME